MDSFSNDEVMRAFRSSDSKIIGNIYTTYYPMVRKFVLTHNGKEKDIEDLLSDSLTAFLIHIDKHADFSLICSFRTYLFTICRNQWYHKLRDMKNYQEISYDNEENCLEIEGEIDDIVSDIEIQKQLLYYKHFAGITEACRKILGMFFDKISLKEIAQQMNVSEGYIKKRNFECKKSLVDKILADKDYKSIIKRI